MVIIALVMSLSVAYAQQAGSEHVDPFIERGEAQIVGHSFSGNPPGVWSGGALLLLQDSGTSAPIIKVFDGAGRELSRFQFQIAGAQRINVYSGGFARGNDGALALVGSAYTGEGRGAAFVAWVSPDGNRQVVVRTSPYAPRLVTIATDGSIWTAGNEFGEEKDGKRGYTQDYDLFRRFDRDGTLLSSHTLRSTLEVAPGYVSPVDYSQLVSSAGRIGWLSEAARTYLEFSLDGKIIRQVRTDKLQAAGDLRRRILPGLALCDDGTTFVSAQWTESNDVKKWGIFFLGNEGWMPNPRSGNWGMLYGCNGSVLAARTQQSSILWLEGRH